MLTTGCKVSAHVYNLIYICQYAILNSTMVGGASSVLPGLTLSRWEELDLGTKLHHRGDHKRALSSSESIELLVFMLKKSVPIQIDGTNTSQSTLWGCLLSARAIYKNKFWFRSNCVTTCMLQSPGGPA